MCAKLDAHSYSSILGQDSATLVYFLKGVRTGQWETYNEAAGKIKLAEVGWGAENVEAFDQCKVELKDAVTLTYPDQENHLCLYTDTLTEFWSAMITEVPDNDMEKPHTDQRHELLAFLSGKLSGDQSRLSIV